MTQNEPRNALTILSQKAWGENLFENISICAIFHTISYRPDTKAPPPTSFAGPECHPPPSCSNFEVAEDIFFRCAARKYVPASVDAGGVKAVAAVEQYN